MKLLAKSIVLNQSGTVKILPEDPDDLWLAYNLLSSGDTVSTDTTRKIYRTSDTGSAAKKNVSRVRVELELKIAAVEYTRDSSAIRVRGKTVVENEHVKAGAFHTIELEKNKEFVLKKSRWDEEKINDLMDGCDASKNTDVAVVLMHDGLANIFLVGKSVTISATVEVRATSNKNGLNTYFQNVFQAFLKRVDFDKVRCVVIGSPGSVKDEFRSYLLIEAQKSKIKSILNNKSRILVAKTGMGDKGSLEEVLQDGAVMSLIKDTKVAVEINSFKEFMDVLSRDCDRACYGLKAVENANALVAVESLLITDDLVRSDDIGERHKFLGLVDGVKKSGGKALVFSPTSVTGKQLTQLTGIAAILRFPLPDLDDMDV